MIPNTELHKDGTVELEIGPNRTTVTEVYVDANNQNWIFNGQFKKYPQQF